MHPASSSLEAAVVGDKNREMDEVQSACLLRGRFLRNRTIHPTSMHFPTEVFVPAEKYTPTEYIPTETYSIFHNTQSHQRQQP